MHETGHNLGLKHGHVTQNGRGGLEDRKGQGAPRPLAQAHTKVQDRAQAFIPFLEKPFHRA